MFISQQLGSAFAHPRIREQLQNAREDPIAAAAAAAGASGGPAQAQNNAENLLDIDFDGSAPASAQKNPSSSTSILEGLTDTPQQVTLGASSTEPAAPTSHNNLDDLMGAFGDRSTPQGNGSADLINGFASLDMGAGNQPPPPQAQIGAPGAKKKNEDILDLF